MQFLLTIWIHVFVFEFIASEFHIKLFRLDKFKVNVSMFGLIRVLFNLLIYLQRGNPSRLIKFCALQLKCRHKEVLINSPTWSHSLMVWNFQTLMFPYSDSFNYSTITLCKSEQTVETVHIYACFPPFFFLIFLSLLNLIQLCKLAFNSLHTFIQM